MRQQSGDISLLRKLNSAATLRILREIGPATYTELAKQARISRPTVEAVIDDLLSDGWAEECEEHEQEQGERRRGRPARRFRFRASTGHVAGVTVGRSAIRAMISDLSGRIVGNHRRPLPADLPAAERVEAIAQLVERAASDAGLTVAALVAVGVGTTGVVDGEGRVVKSVALAGWSGRHLQAELRERLGVPVTVENDMRLAVLAEHWRGAAQGLSNVVYLFTAADRIGMGLLIGGVPYRGAHAASGEIGRQPNGNWIAYRPVIEFAMAEEPGELRSAGQSVEFTIVKAELGEPRAVAAVREFARGLAAGLITVVNPLDPEMVVIGGSLSHAGDLLVPPIQEMLDEYCLYPPRVVASELGAEGITLGAIRFALNQAEQLLFTVTG